MSESRIVTATVAPVTPQAIPEALGAGQPGVVGRQGLDQ